MKRVLKINNYRNIGVSSDGENQSQTQFELLLNPSYDSEKGGLIVLLGHNNVGKSNVISALSVLIGDKDHQLNKNRDINYQNDRNPLPSISIDILSQDNHILSDYNVSLESGTNKSHYTLTLQNEYNSPALEQNEKQFVHQLIGLFKVTGNLTNPFLTALKKDSELTSLLNMYYLHDYAENYLESRMITGLFTLIEKNIPSSYSSQLSNYIQPARSFILSDENKKILDTLKTKYEVNGREKFANNYGFKPTSKIILYQSSFDTSKKFKFNKGDLNIKFENKMMPPNKPTEFFSNLFKIIDYDYSEIVNHYSKSNYEDDPSSLNIKADTDINPKIASTITEDFNKFFSKNGEDNYGMKLYFSENLISFGMTKCNSALPLENCSDGFRWMFDFYFTFYANNRDLNPGDIILMDDPCVYLHDSCIEEFRDYLRKFAEDRHVTIVVATHRPSFVDLDYLEEVRVIKSVDNKAKAFNIFASDNTEINETKDALNYIAEGLSTNRNVLIDEPGKTVIFVEGSTDYYYLTGYKHYLEEKEHNNKYNDFLFLPLGGVLAEKDIVNKVKKIDKIPFFLVDDDGDINQKKGGKAFIEENKNDKSILLFSLNDVKKTFHTIEDLFSKKDLDGNPSSKKTFSKAYILKKKIQNGEMENKTSKNFVSVFKFLYKKSNSYDVVLQQKNPIKK